MYYKMMFKDYCSVNFLKVMEFHDLLLVLLLEMSGIVFFVLLFVMLGSSSSSVFLEKEDLEMGWTIFPSLILLVLSVPSLKLLYNLDSLNFFFSKGKLVKIIGHQWYWSYEWLVDHWLFKYDSFMLNLSSLNLGMFRLLEVDKPLVLKVGVNTLLEGITEDVIHSWSCPSLGVKFDVVPGRLKSCNLSPMFSGIFYGQCSEMCGSNHSFMPIEVEVMKY